MESVLAFFQSLSSFAILVGLASLAFSAWAHRRNRRATDVQGITINPGASSSVQCFDGRGQARRFEPTVAATGPGVRYDVSTLFWEGDRLLSPSLWETDERPRFDIDSEPSRGEVVIPVELTPQVWFGFGWNVVVGGGIRTEFTRVNLSTHEVQVFKWSRTKRLHRWWCEQTWARKLGGGVQKPSGKWKSMPGSKLEQWQFPY